MRAIIPGALLLPLLVPGRQAAQPPRPALDRVLRAFYPRGPGLAAKGLMVDTVLPGAEAPDLLFLEPRGWIRRQVGGAGKGGLRELIGPRGAFRCRGQGPGEPLAGEALARLRLLRDAITLTALWPLMEKGIRVAREEPLLLRTAGGAAVKLTLDEEGLPLVIIRSMENEGQTRVSIETDTPRRNEASGRWPERLTAVGPGGRSLSLQVRRVTGFQPASRRNFFSPPTPDRERDEPLLPPGVKPGRIDFQSFPARRTARIGAPRSAKARDEILLRAKGRLEGMGFRVSGLPFFTRDGRGWAIMLRVKGKGPLPEGMESALIEGGLHAVTFVLGNWGLEILERAVWLERQAWHKGYRALGPPLIIPYHRPGGERAGKGRLLTEIRLPVAARDRE